MKLNVCASLYCKINRENLVFILTKEAKHSGNGCRLNAADQNNVFHSDQFPLPDPAEGSRYLIILAGLPATIA